VNGRQTPFASIRRIVQTQPEIFKVRPGLYALRDFQKKLNLNEYQHAAEAADENIAQGHSYYQGLLVEIGNSRKYSTFVPSQDQNHHFVNDPLGELITTKEIPQFSFSSLVNRAKTIDVIWFNERKMPSSFFEVEHSTDIQHSLMKFYELRDFFAKMVIVADSHRKAEYEQKLKHSALSEIASRINFLGYEILVKQYEYELLKGNTAFMI
jgi:hypothetical protein